MKTKTILFLIIVLLIYLMHYSNIMYANEENKLNKTDTATTSEIFIYLSGIQEQNEKILKNQEQIFKEIAFIKQELKKIKNRL